MAGISCFEDIEARKKARVVTRMIYTLGSRGQFARDFGLKDQIQRAAVSVMSNIAEGFERGGDQEFQQFLALAKGSAGEVRSQLYVALDTGSITTTEFEQASAEVAETSRLISGFMRYLKKSPLKGSKFK